MINEQHRVRVRHHVSNATQGQWLSLLGLGIDGLIHGLRGQDEADRDHRRPWTIAGGEVPDPGVGELPSHGGVNDHDADIIL